MEKSTDVASDVAITHLTVCALSGRAIVVDVEAGQSMITIRSQVADAFGIAPFRVQLVRQDASVLDKEKLANLADGEQLTLLAIEPPPAIDVIEKHACEKVVEQGRSIDALASTYAGGFGFYTWEVPQYYISSTQGIVESLRAILGLLNRDEIGDGGGCAHVGKMLFSAAEDRTAIGVVTYVPANLVEKVSATEWTQHVLNALGVHARYVCASQQHPWVWGCRTDAAMGDNQFLMGSVQQGISIAVDWLRRHGVIADDEDDDQLFGDDAFECLGDS